jgi:hypothetical protein
MMQLAIYFSVCFWPTAVCREEPERTTGVEKSRHSNGVFEFSAFKWLLHFA